MANIPVKKVAPGRKLKVRRKLVNFGEFVKSARERCASSQQQAIGILATASLKMSQSWIAMLETGRITDPDASTLIKVAQAYNLDYDQLIYALIRDKYGLEDLSRITPLSRERWRACAGLLEPQARVGNVPGLEVNQLRAKSELLKAEILDLEGLARWQREFPSLAEMWIVAPQFQDDRNSDLRSAVTHNLARGTRYFYFVRKADLEEGRPFWLFLHRLAQDQPSLRSRLQKQVHGVGLEESDLRWLLTDLVIADPTDPATRTGFIGLRHDRALKFLYRMSDFDAESAVHGVLPFLTKHARRSILNLK